MEDFVATIKWRCNGGDFLNNKYSRAHTWEFDGGAVVPASATYAPGAARSWKTLCIIKPMNSVLSQILLLPKLR